MLNICFVWVEVESLKSRVARRTPTGNADIEQLSHHNCGSSPPSSPNPPPFIFAKSERVDLFYDAKSSPSTSPCMPGSINASTGCTSRPRSMSLTAKSLMVSLNGVGTNNTTVVEDRFGSVGGKNQMKNEDTVGFPSETPHEANVSPITCTNPQQHRSPGNFPSYISPLSKSYEK